MDFQHTRFVRHVQKKRICFGCGKVIPIYDSAAYVVGKYQGDFYTYYMHDKCYEIMQNLPKEFWDNTDGLDVGFINEIHYI